ncbi:hypothetical protein RSAG8_12130, partial [Rhizoctonia solani AG-8 WAC10335]
ARGVQFTRGAEIWASRRLLQRVTINISPQDICPVEPFVEAVEAALSHDDNSLKIQALRKVFATWGEMIPLNMVAGACLAATGILNNKTALPDGIFPTNPPSGDRPYVLTDIVDQYLGTTKTFLRRLESRVQGGSSEVLLNKGYEAWLKSVIDNPETWTIIKVHHAVPITEILSDQLRQRVEQLFTNTITYGSPSAGAPHGFGFDGAAHGLRTIENVTIWYSDQRIRDISITYTGGAVAGPYSFGIGNPHSPSDTLKLTPGEYITDMFVWHHTEGWITGVQFVKSSSECSPIYGMRDRESVPTHPLVLLSGNGNALLGISGAYDSDNINQVKVVWRRDVILGRQRHTQTCFTGSNHGHVFNDLPHLADPATSRIVQISARVGGSVASFQTTYLSVGGGGLIRSETPPRGWDLGPMRTMALEEDEYIIGIRGNHNNSWLHQIQFITNKKEHPPFGTDKGDISFSFDAPKTIDGRDMVLHYMAGKSGGCVHSFLFVWAEMPLQA